MFLARVRAYSALSLMVKMRFILTCIPKGLDMSVGHKRVGTLAGGVSC